MEILIASRNEGKIEEIKSYFRDLPDIGWLTYRDFKGLPEIRESGKSFLENSILKAKILSGFSGKLTLADDSGLEVDILGGRPGIYSSRFAGSMASDSENRNKLLNELSEYKNPGQRKARFVCSLVLWDPAKGLVFKTDGICGGYIGFKEIGTGGFGYDPIFIPDGYKKTMAQLETDEKSLISHRGRALKELRSFIVNF